MVDIGKTENTKGPINATVSSASPPHVIIRAPSLLDDSTDEKNESRRLERIYSAVMSWPTLEAWPFRFGHILSSVPPALTGFWLNSWLRKELSMTHHIRMVSYSTVVFIPTVATTVGYTFLVSRAVIQNDPRQCPICLQIRGGTILAIGGVLYPLILTPVVNFQAAIRLKGLYVPNLVKDPKGVFWYFVDLMQPALRRKLMMVAGGQFVFGMALTYFQQMFFKNTVAPILSGDEDVSKFLPKPQKVDRDFTGFKLQV